MLEKIEDEQDASDLDEALSRFKNPAIYSLDDLRKVYDLQDFLTFVSAVFEKCLLTRKT